MAKKSRNLVRLASLSSLLVAALTLSGCRLDTSGARQNDGEITSATPYTIEVDIDDSIAVEVAESALPGEIVPVELTYDADKVELSSVLANGDKIAKEDEDSFYFEMPAENVVLTVDAVIQGDFSLVNLNPDVELYGYDALGFNAGEEVSFSLGLPPDSPYTVIDVEVGILNADATAIETPIDVEYANDVYTFAAPADLTRDVGVLASTEVKMFAIDFLGTNVSKVYETVGEEKVDITSKKHAYYGNTVTVVLKDTEALIATGIHIVETDETIAASEVDGEKVCTFTMPAKNITMEVQTEENRIPLNLVNGEHVTVIPSLLDEETGELVPIEDQKAVPGEQVYLDYETTDPNFLPVDFYVSYKSPNGYDSSVSVYEDASNGWHYFRMPNALQVTIEVTEGERQVFTLNHSTNLQIKTYSLVDGEYVETDGAFPGETVYLEAVDTSGTGIEPVAWSVSYIDEWGDTDSIDVHEPYYGDEYASFTMENGTDYVISVIEDDPTRFEGESFVGDYVFGNIYDNIPDRELTSSYSIGANGQASDDSWIIRVDPIDDVSGTIHYTDGKIAVYGDGFLFSAWTSGGVGNSLTNDDANVFAKAEEGVSLHGRAIFGKYSENIEEYNSDVGFYQIYAVVDGQEEIRANFVIFYDADNPVQYLSGVEFNISGEEGATILTADSVTATVDGETLGTLSVSEELYTPAE